MLPVFACAAPMQAPMATTEVVAAMSQRRDFSMMRSSICFASDIPGRVYRQCEVFMLLFADDNQDERQRFHLADPARAWREPGAGAGACRSAGEHPGDRLDRRGGTGDGHEL